MAKILIADDEIQMLDVIARAVNSMGHTTIRSRNGRAALEILGDNPDIELLITDVSMPEMAGDDMVKQIRLDKDMTDFPMLNVLFVIGAKDISNLLKIGATAFMPKPVSISELKEFVNKHIGSNKN